MAALGLRTRRCKKELEKDASRLSLVAESKGYSPVAVRGFLIEAASLVYESRTLERRLNSCGVWPLLDLPAGSDGEASAYRAGDPGSIPGLGRSAGEGNGNPLQ